MYNVAWQMFQDELGSDEKLLWSDQPKQGIFFRTSDLLIVPFSLSLIPFAGFWMSIFAKEGVSFFFVLFIIVFLIQALYLIVGRFFAEASQRKHTYYALTNKRIIIITGKPSRQRVKSLAVKSLVDISFIQKKDGTGIIILGSTAINGIPLFYDSTLLYMGQAIPPCLDTIPEAKYVYEQIRDVHEKSLLD